MAIDRETLGREVRAEWVAWAREQPHPKPSWIESWEALTEPEREVDRRIGERIARLALTNHVPLETFEAWVHLTRRLADAVGDHMVPEDFSALTEEERAAELASIALVQEALVALQSVGIGEGLPATAGAPVIVHTLQDEVGAWGDATFPSSTEDSVLAHFRSEVGELLASRHPEEAADCHMLLMQFAHKRGFSLDAETRRKLEVNKARTWGKPNAEGFVEHVR